MIAGRRVLALVPARGGSKRLPRKNVLPLAGRPMIGWTIAAALASTTVDRVVLSSDDAEIIAVARACGCEAPFVRAPELATDTADSMDVIFDALDRVADGFDELVLLQPTSPLRSAADIDACVRLRVETDVHAVVSVNALPKPRNHYGRIVGGSHFVRTGVFADEEGPIVSLNGAVYVADVARLRRLRGFYDDSTLAHEMPADRSVDVDTPLDFAFAEVLLRGATDAAGGA